VIGGFVMSASAELYSIKRELLQIVDELEAIADGIYRDFEGIGNERCTSRLNNLASHYRDVKYRLDHIDITNVRED
jgi:hypothetical protein